MSIKNFSVIIVSENFTIKYFGRTNERQNKKLQKEKDVAILAHYYVDGEVQKIADYVGDSFYLAKTATKLKNKTIIMAGVYFMGESIKILNPEKQCIWLIFMLTVLWHIW